MKRIFRALVLFVLIPSSVFAFVAQSFSAPVTLAWDMPDSSDLPNVKETRIFDVLAGVATQVATAPCTGAPNACPNTASFAAPIGPHNWIARFFDGFQESGDSNTVSTPTKNPKNLIKK
jgi:hypothetical protein